MSMKSIVFKIDEQLFKDIHIRAAENGKSIQDYMCDLIKSDLTQNENPDQVIETMLEKIEDIQDTLRLSVNLLEISTKQLRERRTELETKMSDKPQVPSLTLQ